MSLLLELPAALRHRLSGKPRAEKRVSGGSSINRSDIPERISPIRELTFDQEREDDLVSSAQERRYNPELSEQLVLDGPLFERVSGISGYYVDPTSGRRTFQNSWNAFPGGFDREHLGPKPVTRCEPTGPARVHVDRILRPGHLAEFFREAPVRMTEHQVVSCALRHCRILPLKESFALFLYEADGEPRVAQLYENEKKLAVEFYPLSLKFLWQPDLGPCVVTLFPTI